MLPSKFFRRTFGALVALLSFSLSCDSSTKPDPDPGSQISLSQSTISASQSSIVANGSTSSQITVALKDAQGASIGKSAGALSMSATRGTLSAVSDQNNGTYTATLTSSTSAGPSVVSASIGAGSLTNTATVNFVAGPAAIITIANASSNGQSAVVGSTVANPPSVKVTDVNNNPVSGLSVTFAVATGGGSITGANQTTNDAGVATVGSWRLGNSVGTNTLTATVAVAAIAGFAGTSAMADLTVTFTATATAGSAGSIAINAGNSQTATAGSAVATAPSVKVTDGNGNPVSGTPVNFVVASGGGSITGANATSNSSGIATVGSWTLGDIAGANTLTAGAVGLSGTVTFSATGVAGAAVSIAIANATSNNQTAPAGAAVGIPPSVKVVDAKGNGVSGISVTFAVASGGGSITGASATTDASGIAQVGSWTLGTSAGPNSLTATSGSLTGSPVTFNATGTSGAAGNIAIVGGDGQTAIAGNTVATAPSVKVTDANGNIVAGAMVTFTVASGGGSVTGGTATTNASGIATVGSWRLGTTAGTNTLTASSGALPAVTFTATGTAGAAALIAINTGNNQFATTGTVVAIPPSAKVTDANGNAVAGAGVTFAVTAGGGSIPGASATSNASGIATVGSWTLGAVGTNSLSATLTGVSGQSVTFNATATAFGGLVVTVSGKLERSETVTVNVTQDGTALTPSQFTISLTPPDGGTVNNSDATIKLLKAGALTINVQAGTRNGVANINVATPPLIVFDLARNGMSPQVFQVAIDNLDLKQITTVGSTNEHPSRVGSKIVYSGSRGGGTEIFMIDTITGAETQLTTNSVPERNPNLSPDGKRVTYVSERTIDRAYYLNLSGGGEALATDTSATAGSDEFWPSWSPSSDKVIYSSAASGLVDMYIATLGALPQRLPSPANSSSVELSPVWSPSGKIAFHTYRSGRDEIWVTDPTGATATKLTDGIEPTWLPDGRLVFVRIPINQSGPGSLFWIDITNPSVEHPIVIAGGGSARNPSGVIPAPTP